MPRRRSQWLRIFGCTAKEEFTHTIQWFPPVMRPMPKIKLGVSSARCMGEEFTGLLGAGDQVRSAI